jgi:transaldolase
MMREAEVLRKIADNVCIKVPLTIDGLKTCKALTGDGTMVNVTLCFSANQALLAAKAGASFISPFVGRHDDNGFDGMDLIRDIRLIYDNYDFATEILVASVRHGIHVLESAKIGADVMTAASRDQGPVQARADRQGHRGLPGRLGQDRAEHPLTRMADESPSTRFKRR